MKGIELSVNCHPLILPTYYIRGMLDDLLNSTCTLLYLYIICIICVHFLQVDRCEIEKQLRDGEKLPMPTLPNNSILDHPQNCMNHESVQTRMLKD